MRTAPLLAALTIVTLAVPNVFGDPPLDPALPPTPDEWAGFLGALDRAIAENYPDGRAGVGTVACRELPI
jgi:hypothetical protein